MHHHVHCTIMPLCQCVYSISSASRAPGTHARQRQSQAPAMPRPAPDMYALHHIPLSSLLVGCKLTHANTLSTRAACARGGAYAWTSVVGHRCQARNDRAWAGGRGTVGASQGKVYYEVTVADEGLCRVGWSTRQAGLDLGTEPISFGFGGTGGNSIASEHATASEWC